VNEVIQAAVGLQVICQSQGWQFCFSCAAFLIFRISAEHSSSHLLG
jgi:hypothetical protein